MPALCHCAVLFCSNFVQSAWGMEEFTLADAEVVNGRRDFLIVVLKERLNVDNLPPVLQTYMRKLFLEIFGHN